MNTQNRHSIISYELDLVGHHHGHRGQAHCRIECLKIVFLLGLQLFEVWAARSSPWRLLSLHDFGVILLEVGVDRLLLEVLTVV